MKIYISGRITRNKNYAQDFRLAEMFLGRKGHIILNPTCLPEGLEYHEYMDIDMAMIRACDAIAMIPGWEDSSGAEAELAYARCIKKEVMYLKN